MIRHRDAVTSQTKTRERVRDLAEVYTREREVKAMLDLVPDMFPSGADPKNIGRTFLEPACGSGNFLVEILDRKLAYVGRPHQRTAATIEAAALRALSSIYGIDIDQSNVDASRHYMRVEMEHHMNIALSTEAVSSGFFSAVDAVLASNIVRANTLTDAKDIDIVEYHWQRKAGYVIREWSKLEETEQEFDLFTSLSESAPARDTVPIHFSLLADNPDPVAAPTPGKGAFA
ncbi:hypothetical protein SAMN06296429_106121 [Janibacter indicus]|uniref:Restriction endonuclease subunit M n=2 Tax=Janibacter indicus TaxID=857417 RepID=A0A1W2APV0_9MICO|nr:hypothetical protein SAMN06296429_106121 [Janibacter indicus]